MPRRVNQNAHSPAYRMYVHMVQEQQQFLFTSTLLIIAFNL